MDYFEHMRLRLAGRDASSYDHLSDKSEVRKFAIDHGLLVPQLYFTGPLEELPEDLPDRFVLKPSFGSTSIGVHLLQRTHDGEFLNVGTSEVMSRQEILSRSRVAAQRFLNDDSQRRDYIVEELLSDVDGSCPARDIRFYAFAGVIGLIQIESHWHVPSSSMYFDGSFQPFDDLEQRFSIATKTRQLESIVPAVRPPEWQALMATAVRISIALPTEFCRIDLYNCPRGVYVGELTFEPGTFYFRNRKLMSDSEAHRLGLLWSDARSRISS